MTQLGRSALVWLSAFLALELTALVWKGCPWLMLTTTVREGISWWHPIALLASIFIFTLWGHFERNWSVWYLIAEGALMFAAILTHLETR